jgi:GNAT superfamily N-acetyltransferase
MAETPAPPDLTIHPLTAERWPDLETLFGPRGACGGCWCMWWRLGRSEFEQQKGQVNRQALRAIVESGAMPGLLGYQGGQPIAWVAVAPRESYPVLERSRNLKRVDDAPVWSITCLFVAPPFRRRGITVLMLRAAVAHAVRGGAQVVEGYPIEPQADAVPAVFAWTGLASAFRQAGFAEVLRRAPTRPIMRYEPVRD